MLNEDEKKLLHDIRQGVENLTKELNRYTSLKAALVRGIVYGIGTAIGATVLAAVLVGLFLWVFEPIINEVPFLDDTDTIEQLESIEANVFEGQS